MRLGTAIVLALLAPCATAGVPFVADYEDPRGDIEAPSVDVVRVTSSVAGGIVTQRVEMAAAPDPLLDTVILRSWFHNTTNGSFDVIDLETHAAAQWRAIMRRERFDNVTPLEDASYSIEGNAYVFTFHATHVEDATCFDVIVWAQHRQADRTAIFDAGGASERGCRLRGDPPLTPDTPVIPSVTGSFPDSFAPTVPPPGSRMPALGAPTILSIAAVFGLAFLVGNHSARGPKS